MYTARAHPDFPLTQTPHHSARHPHPVTQTKAKREAEQEALRKQNAQMRERLSQVKAVTDDDITDDAAGGMRMKLAAQAVLKKKQEQDRLKEANVS